MPSDWDHNVGVLRERAELLRLAKTSTPSSALKPPARYISLCELTARTLWIAAMARPYVIPVILISILASSVNAAKGWYGEYPAIVRIDPSGAPVGPGRVACPGSATRRTAHPLPVITGRRIPEATSLAFAW